MAVAGAAPSDANEETAELLDLPLHSSEGGARAQALSDGIDTDASASIREQFLGIAVDIVLSVVFWTLYLLLFSAPDAIFYSILGVLLALIIAYRIYRGQTFPDKCSVEIPYTCGYVQNNDKELFLVATIHISPRAPKDVEAVIAKTVPDLTMIELDDERLNRMRDVEAKPQEPRPEDLQPIQIAEAGGVRSTVLAQRALWNGEYSGNSIAGDVVFDDGNEYGLQPMSNHHLGKLSLVRRGSPNGEFAPFAIKAHNAAKGGAEALLVINQPGSLPVHRIGGGTLAGDLRVALSTCNCGFPPIPVLLLPKEDGDRLVEVCKFGHAGSAHAELEVLADNYPRRTLRRHLCQSAALMFTGIGILYGIIQCFNVEVGAEFLAAEVEASARGIPCKCIDVDLNRFWSRLGWAVLPTPCNLLRSLRSWLCFPRVVFRMFFPPSGNVDVLGSMVLHATSFPLRTWVAFILAGLGASFVTSNILQLFGFGIEQAGEETGVVKEEDASLVQALIMLAVELYMLPQVYDAVAASRDEAMYRSIVEKGRHARRSVVVVGAGHANGILQHCRTRGL